MSERASAPSDANVARAMHARIQQSAGALRVSKSTLNGRVSSHTIPSSIPFSNMIAFQKIAIGERCGEMTFLGSIQGELVLSVNTGYSKPESNGKKKRQADTTAEEADRAIAKIKKSGDDAMVVSKGSYAVAKETISEMMKLKGASGEPVLESWAVSLRRPGEYGAALSESGRPSLVIAMRLAGGIAIPLSMIYTAVKACRDGLVTVSTDSVNSDFDLPMTEQCREAHDRGQKSLLLLASVPYVEDASAESAAPSSQ